MVRVAEQRLFHKRPRFCLFDPYKKERQVIKSMLNLRVAHAVGLKECRTLFHKGKCVLVYGMLNDTIVIINSYIRCPSYDEVVSMVISDNSYNNNDEAKFILFASKYGEAELSRIIMENL